MGTKARVSFVGRQKGWPGWLRDRGSVELGERDESFRGEGCSRGRGFVTRCQQSCLSGRSTEDAANYASFGGKAVRLFDDRRRFWAGL